MKAAETTPGAMYSVDSGTPPRSQKADIETSSEDYARRFSGNVGEYFLDVQSSIALELLDTVRPSSILDVGGGHGQLALPLVHAGYPLTVAGSDAVCEDGLRRVMDCGEYHYQSCDLLSLPFEDNSFDTVTCFRLLAHEENWKLQVAELCRVARRSVLIDYPDIRSFNIFYRLLFRLKKKYEGNTRTFLYFSRAEMADEFEKHGFGDPEFRPEFFLPMVLHRMLGQAGMSRAIERVIRVTGLTRCLGSPIIAHFHTQQNLKRAGRQDL